MAWGVEKVSAPHFLGDTIVPEFIAIQQCVFFLLFLLYRAKACSDSLKVLLAALRPSHQITFSFLTSELEKKS